MSEKAFGYVRVSGNSQVEGDGPVRQKLAINQFAKSSGFEVANIFQDLAVSGTVDGLDRPQFSALVAECESSGCKTIIVEKLERFARDLMVSEVLFSELRKRGIKLYACDQGTQDLVMADDDPTRTMVRQLFGVLAQYEKSSLVIKLRVARERARAAGGARGGNPAYGVGNTPRARMEKRILSLIADLRSTNASWNTVALALTHGGFERRSGLTKWTAADAWKVFRHSPEYKPRWGKPD